MEEKINLEVIQKFQQRRTGIEAMSVSVNNGKLISERESLLSHSLTGQWTWLRVGGDHRNINHR